MTTGYAHPIGISMGDMVPPEKTGEKARWLEGLGYSHLTILEDYFSPRWGILKQMPQEPRQISTPSGRSAMSRSSRALPNVRWSNCGHERESYDHAGSARPTVDGELE
jgi:hypothetical protein